MRKTSIGTLNTADTVYGRITYVLDDASTVSIANSPPTGNDVPYTGRGFTASENIVLPEYIQVERPFQTGDVFTIFDAKTGDAIRTFSYVEEKGWKLIGDY